MPLEPQLLLIDKPAGVTSHDIVAWWRRELRPLAGGPLKVGHAGTLDPLAAGLLIILVAGATRAQAAFLQSMKKYEFIIQLGEQRETGDAAGKIIVRRPVPLLTDTDIETAAAQLVGKLVMPVPSYAAAKVRGHKLYQYARRQEMLPWCPLRVCTIQDLVVADYDRRQQQVTLRVTCSAGTYVRSLAEIIAVRLGTVGYTHQLRRLQSGAFSVADAHYLEPELFGLTGEGSREAKTQHSAIGQR